MPAQLPVSRAKLGTTPALPIDGCVQRENAGFLAPGQTKISVNVDNVSIATGASVPLPTPPAGKVWLIGDLYVSHDSNVAVRCALTVGGITVWSAPVKGDTAPVELPGMETQIDVPQGQASVLAFGGNAGTHGYANLQGWQQGIGVG